MAPFLLASRNRLGDSAFGIITGLEGSALRSASDHLRMQIGRAHRDAEFAEGEHYNRFLAAHDAKRRMWARTPSQEGEARRARPGGGASKCFTREEPAPVQSGAVFFPITSGYLLGGRKIGNGVRSRLGGGHIRVEREIEVQARIDEWDLSPVR